MKLIVFEEGSETFPIPFPLQSDSHPLVSGIGELPTFPCISEVLYTIPCT